MSNGVMHVQVNAACAGGVEKQDASRHIVALSVNASSRLKALKMAQAELREEYRPYAQGRPVQTHLGINELHLVSDALIEWPLVRRGN